MQTTHEKTIGDLKLRMGFLSLSQMNQLTARLVRVGGPTLAALLDGAATKDDGAVDLGSVQTSSIKAAAFELALRLDASDLEYVIDTLASVTTTQTERGGLVPFDAETRSLALGGGRYYTAARFIVWGLQVQYADFLGAFAALGLSDAVKASFQSASPKV